jgi:hypothetical protein
MVTALLLIVIDGLMMLLLFGLFTQRMLLLQLALHMSCWHISRFQRFPSHFRSSPSLNFVKVIAGF